MSYNPRYHDDRRRSKSPGRRHSPPHDVRHGRDGDLRARGQADSRSSSHGGSVGGDNNNARGDYRPNRRPHQDYRSRYQDERDDRDYYDDRYHDNDRHRARQPHDQRRDYRDRDGEGYGPSWRDQDRNPRYERTRSPRRDDGPRREHGRDKFHGGSGSSDWLCEVCGNNNPRGRRSCASCQASDSAQAPGRSNPRSERDLQYAQHGADDVGGENDETQFLIFRNLEANVTEELLAKGAAKLLKSDEERQTAPGKMQSTSAVAHAGANPGSIKRVFLVRDRVTGATWRYGLVEFATIQDARAARLKYNSMTGQKKFTIASKPVQVDNAHGGVFVPVMADPSADQGAPSSFVSSTNPNLRLTYRSEHAYAQELRVAEEDEEEEKKKKAGEQKDVAANAKSTQQNEPKSKLKKQKASDAGDAAPQKKTMQLPASLQKWTARQKELHGEKPAEPTGPAATSTGKLGSGTAPTGKAPLQQSFAYIGEEGNCCLLCRSIFPDEATLNRHERLDRKHRIKLRSPELVEKGKKALKKRGVDPEAQSVKPTQPQEAPTQYRDRAKERRSAFQPIKQLGGQQQASAKGGVPQQFLDEPPSPPREAPSKAARMLAKQGWTAGQGLGSRLSGTTEALAPSLYAEGVGLGAVGSRLGDAADEAARRTRGNASEQAARHKQKAAERYRQLE